MKLPFQLPFIIAAALLLTVEGCTKDEELYDSDQGDGARAPYLATFPNLSRSFLPQINRAGELQNSSSIRYPFCIHTLRVRRDAATEEKVRQWSTRAMNTWIKPLVGRPGWTVSHAEAYRVQPSGSRCPSTDNGLTVYEIEISDLNGANNNAAELHMRMGNWGIQYNVVLHEMGHGIGLADTYETAWGKPIYDVPDAVMNNAHQRNGILSQDDIDCIRFIWARIRGDRNPCPDGYTMGQIQNKQNGSVSYKGPWQDTHCFPDGSGGGGDDGDDNGGGGDCVDDSSYAARCPGWANKGYCKHSYVEFMHANCCASCNGGDDNGGGDDGDDDGGDGDGSDNGGDDGDGDGGSCVEAVEGRSATLSCSNGEAIKSIDFASYGVPKGSCSAGLSTGNCHWSNSKSKVQSRCLNKQSCTVGANNGTFGDPCAGKSKKLAVVYSCSGGTTGLAAKDFVGHYERTPVSNNWHKVDITLENNASRWKNAAGVGWSLVYASGVLKTGSDCPYGVQVIDVEKQSGHDPVKSLKFRNERYYKRSGDNDGNDDGNDNDNGSDQCPNDPNKTEPGKCGCGVPETQCSGGGSCAAGCSAPTPICGPDSKCTSKRWVEPISTLPSNWKSSINTSVWTKWVRSVIPIIGQASTQDAALLEVAYYAERIHMPRGQVLVPDLINSMLGAHPTRFSVYPACPKAFMHPVVKPTMSSGGGGANNTLVSEDWILRYPKCTGRFAVACDAMPAGTLCNNCQWQNSSPQASCRDTLAHEHGHTCDLHSRQFMDSSVDALARQVFPSNNTEGPAWAAAAYFMNPSLESSTGRDRGQRTMPAKELNYWSVAHKFTMSKYPAGWGYTLKTTRCPQQGLTQACPDTLTRTYTVPLDR